MNTVKAKFECKTVVPLQAPDDGSKQIMLEPVYTGSEENETWSKYTPGGRIEMDISNPPAAEMFEVGKEYFINITPAD